MNEGLVILWKLVAVAIQAALCGRIYPNVSCQERMIYAITNNEMFSLATAWDIVTKRINKDDLIFLSVCFLSLKLLTD